MKLNLDCIRGVLLTAEEICTSEIAWTYKKDQCNSSYLSSFDHSEIIYHIVQSEDAGLIKKVSYYNCKHVAIIDDLTPAGHEFLANIREDSIWKKIVKKASCASLPVLMEAAKDLALKHLFS